MVQRDSRSTVDVDLGHHREADAVVELAEFGDFVVAGGVLATKLVAGEAQHHQAAFTIGLVQCFQAGELRRETAGAGGVNDQHDPAFVLAQDGWLTVDEWCVEIVNSGHELTRIKREDKFRILQFPLFCRPPRRPDRQHRQQRGQQNQGAAGQGLDRQTASTQQHRRHAGHHHF